MRAAVFRTGAYGDLMFASSVFASLKRSGYEVTLIAANPSAQIVAHDPHIDHVIFHDNTMPMDKLNEYWDKLQTEYDLFVNLSASIECEILQLPGQPTYHYPLDIRKKLYDRNYLDHQHLLAGNKNAHAIKFYATDTEIEISCRNRSKFGSKILVWVLSGSSIHKVNPHINTYLANILKMSDVDVVILGSPDQNSLADGLKGVDRVHLCTHWDIRQQYTFVQQHADVIVGPETGIMVAMAYEPLKKIVLLSHSTPNMLTRDWVRAASIEAPVESLPCGGCCKYRLLEGDAVTKYEDTEFACCQVLTPMHLAFASAVETLTCTK